MRKCKGCGVDISKKHPNAKFHSKKCKDKYWNTENPRGKFAHLKGVENKDDDYEYAMAESESGWDGHKGTW